MKGKLAVMGPEGDTKIEWDSDNKEEVKLAKEHFIKLLDKGYTAFGVKKDGTKGNVRIEEFDPDIEKIILVPRLAGGGR